MQKTLLDLGLTPQDNSDYHIIVKFFLLLLAGVNFILAISVFFPDSNPFHTTLGNIENIDGDFIFALYSFLLAMCYIGLYNKKNLLKWYKILHFVAGFCAIFSCFSNPEKVLIFTWVVFPLLSIIISLFYMVICNLGLELILSIKNQGISAKELLNKLAAEANKGRV